MTFKKGKSGNPKGRPQGASGCRQKLFNEVVMPDKEVLIAKAKDLALSGNEQMLKVFLERILPAKINADPIDPIGVLTGTLAEQAQMLLDCMTSGKLSLVEGETLLKSLALKAQLADTNELINRIEKLENKI